MNSNTNQLSFEKKFLDQKIVVHDILNKQQLHQILGQ